jgi:Spy/CpxP family protein refolding chaperone
MTTRPIWIALCTLTLAAALAAPAEAQKKRRRPGDGPGDGPEPSAEMIEKMRQKVRAAREWKLTEALELDQATADKLFPVIESFDDKFIAAMRDGHKLRRELRALLDGGKPADKDVNAIVDKMLDNQRAIWELNEKRFAAARKVLTAEQAAKALIVLPQIDQEIRKQIRQAKQKRRPAGASEDPF